MGTAQTLEEIAWTKAYICAMHWSRSMIEGTGMIDADKFVSLHRTDLHCADHMEG